MAAKKKRWADLKAAHRNTRESVRIPWDAEAADEAERLEVELQRVREEDDQQNRLPQAPKLAERIVELERKARESEVTFTFAGIGRRRYQLLIDAHQATQEQNDAAGEKLPYNPETFPPALFAASCIEPADLHADIDAAGNITDSDVLNEWTEIHDEWSVGHVNRLWRSCTRANAGVNEAPKSLLASTILALTDSAQS